MNSDSIQRYARTAGILIFLSIFAGGFGEVYVPSQIISYNNASATAVNLRSSELLFRLGFASYLVEAMCDIALSLVMYVLLKPVNMNMALLAAFFGLVSTAVFACAQLFNFASLLFIGDADYLDSFSSDQVDTLMLLSFKLYGYGFSIFTVFYGVASALRGYLIFRSGYLPKFLGALLLLAGLGFVTSNFLLVLTPSYASDLLHLPMLLAGVSLAAWLLWRGVDVARWKSEAAAST